MNFRAGEKEAQKLAEEKATAQQKKDQQEAPVHKLLATKATQPTQVTQEDLFSAHDFDIKIDLEVPLPGKSTKMIHTSVYFLKKYLFYGYSMDLLL